MVKPEIKVKIDDAAHLHNLDPDLVEAFVMTESSGKPGATRYEPAFYRKYILPILMHNVIDEHEAKGRATSWGLMQIMGQVVREMGFAGPFEELFEPCKGLDWSCKYLKRKFDKYEDNGLDAVIASYNAGSPRKLQNGKYVNQGYVDKVNKYYDQIRKGG